MAFNGLSFFLFLSVIVFSLMQIKVSLILFYYLQAYK